MPKNYKHKLQVKNDACVTCIRKKAVRKMLVKLTPGMFGQENKVRTRHFVALEQLVVQVLKTGMIWYINGTTNLD
jgi:hypothetical protein